MCVSECTDISIFILCKCFLTNIKEMLEVIDRLYFSKSHLVVQLFHLL
jgi:hypothetical protein